MRKLKRFVALVLCLVMMTALSMPVHAAETSGHAHDMNAPKAGLDAACPECGKVGEWMYDVEMPSGYWYLTMAVYYCPKCDITYHFYF